jgi:hypothetical protein
LTTTTTKIFVLADVIAPTLGAGAAMAQSEVPSSNEAAY